jgi:phosphoenolpyruvate carboxykinase (ATP)
MANWMMLKPKPCQSSICKCQKPWPDWTGSVLDPRSSYEDPAEWEKRARHLGGLFVDNFEKFTDTDAGKALVAAGPQID